jgi:hypothetical protein
MEHSELSFCPESIIERQRIVEQLTGTLEPDHREKEYWFSLMHLCALIFFSFQLSFINTGNITSGFHCFPNDVCPAFVRVLSIWISVSSNRNRLLCRCRFGVRRIGICFPGQYPLYTCPGSRRSQLSLQTKVYHDVFNLFRVVRTSYNRDCINNLEQRGLRPQRPITAQ